MDSSGKKIVFLCSNCDRFPNSGKKTGNYLSEVAKPYRVLKDAGFSIVFASPNGGRISLDPSSVEQEKGDGMCRDFLDDRDAARMMEDTQRLDDILRDLDSIDAVFYPGGHGCMFDVGQDQRAGALAAGVFERGGVVGAVCHGVVGLVTAKLSNGKRLVEGRRVTCFSNAEEREVKMDNLVPFLLEDKLKECGGHVHCADNWANCVEVDHMLVTGQNPASALGVGQAMAGLLMRS